MKAGVQHKVQQKKNKIDKKKQEIKDAAKTDSATGKDPKKKKGETDTQTGENKSDPEINKLQKSKKYNMNGAKHYKMCGSQRPEEGMGGRRKAHEGKPMER